MVSLRVNSLRMNFLRKKMGVYLLSGYQNALFRVTFIKKMKDCSEKQGNRFSTEAFPWLMGGRNKGLTPGLKLGQLCRTILAPAPLGTD